jgi:hypothetical protein
MTKIVLYRKHILRVREDQMEERYKNDYEENDESTDKSQIAIPLRLIATA